MIKVLISGFYGFHNIGDEAILRTLIEELESAHSSVDITVLSENPEETMRKFGVQAFKRNSIPALLKNISKCDILINGGGSLLQDSTSIRSIIYYVSIIIYAKLLRKKVAQLSGGIGPLRTWLGKKLTKIAIGAMKFATVRDSDSLDLLNKIGADTSRTYVTGDLVLDLENSGPESGINVLKSLGMDLAKDRKKIGIAVREKDFRDPQRLEKLAELANNLASHADIVFLPFYYKNDTKLAGKISDKTAGNVYFLTEKNESAEFLSIISNLDLLIGSRLHSLIFALVTTTPFLGVSYDPKVDSFLKMLDMQPVCHVLDFDPDRLLSHSLKILETLENQNMRQELSLHLLKLKSDMQKNRDLLKDLFEQLEKKNA